MLPASEVLQIYYDMKLGGGKMRKLDNSSLIRNQAPTDKESNYVRAFELVVTSYTHIYALKQKFMYHISFLFIYFF